MKTKPDLGFWKLWNLSFGFFGVQIAYALQSANVSRIFATIGADPHELSYFWILPPLMGLLIQPIIGTLSDRTWTRFGRRLPYLIIGALIAVLVMCILPNAGSLGLTVSSAIIIGLFALMLLDTSINMAMQPFKMLVGDMVNEKQKGLAYSIQSFLCNSGSVVGFVLPFCLAWAGLSKVAPQGVVPQTVIWSFYIGAGVLLACVVYSLVKIKEWPPKVYNEYNGITEEATEKKKKTNLFALLIKAPSTFWTVGLVQFFCWFAFLFMWTYTTGTVAHTAFNTPTTEKISAIEIDQNGKKEVLKNKYFLVGDNIIIENGTALPFGYEDASGYHAAKQIIILPSDTIMSNGKLVADSSTGVPKADYEKPFASAGQQIKVDSTTIQLSSNAVLKDYISLMHGPIDLTSAAIVATDNTTGQQVIQDFKTYHIAEASDCIYEKKTDLNTASPQYNAAGDWVGILFAVQAAGSVLWALALPRFRNRKFSYSLSLIIGAAGFVMAGLIHHQYLLIIPFLMLGCPWAAMLAWPFTILTNSLKGGNIGAYLGLFNCTICIPQIVGAIAGGSILNLFSNPHELAPQWIMMIVAGISLAIGSICVAFIKDKQ